MFLTTLHVWLFNMSVSFERGTSNSVIVGWLVIIVSIITHALIDRGLHYLSQ